MPIPRRALLLGALAAPAFVRDLSAQANELRIAAVSSQTGAFAYQGEEALRAITFATEQANAAGGVAGRRVVVSVADDEGTPEAGRRVAERLVLSGHRIITGPISSAVSLALGTQLDRWDAVYVVNNSKADRITGENCRRRVVRCIQSDSMDFQMLLPWLRERPERRAAILAGDYAWGRSSAEGFAAAVQAAGREVAGQLFVPVGTRDFAPYIAQLRGSPADLVWLALAGQDAINFSQQAAGFGLARQKTVAGHHLILTQVLQTVGATLEGVWGNLPWSVEFPGEANRAFVAAWQARFNRLPTENEALAWLSMGVLFDAVRATDATDPAALVARLSGSSFETILGRNRIRPEDNQMVMPNLLGRVAQHEGAWRARLQGSFAAEQVTPPPSAACRMRA